MRTDYATVSVRVLSDPASLLHEWTELAERVGTVFSSRPDFVLSCVNALGLDCEMFAVHRGNRLVACAVLSRVRRGPFVLAKVVGTNLGVPLEILSEDGEASNALLGAVADRGYLLSADSMIVNGVTMECLLGHSSWRVHAPVRERVPVVELRHGQTASSIRGAKSLKRLRQYRRSAGSFEIETVTSVEHVEARWPDIARVAEVAIDGTDKVNYLVTPEGDTALNYLKAEAGAGRLVIAGIVVDGTWCAHEIGLRTGRRLEGWLTHYDPRIAQWQPGHQLIEWFADNHDHLGVDYLDQGVGVNRIKSTWSNSGYDVLGLSAVPSRSMWSPLLLVMLRKGQPALSRVRRAGSRVLSKLSLETR